MPRERVHGEWSVLCCGLPRTGVPTCALRSGLRVWTPGWRVTTHVHVRDGGEAPAGGPLLDGGHPGLQRHTLRGPGWPGGRDDLLGFICNGSGTVSTGVTVGPGAVRKVPTCLLREESSSRASGMAHACFSRKHGHQQDPVPAPHVDRRERRLSQQQRSLKGPVTRGHCFLHTRAVHSWRRELSQRRESLSNSSAVRLPVSAVARVSGPSTRGWRRLGSVGAGRGRAGERRQPPLRKPPHPRN